MAARCTWRPSCSCTRRRAEGEPHPLPRQLGRRCRTCSPAASPMIMDVAAGGLPYIQRGELRALGDQPPTRACPRRRTCPTFTEGGVPDVESYTWHMVMAPAGTPAPVVQAVNAAFNRALAQEAVQDRLTEMTMNVTTDSTPESAARLLAGRDGEVDAGDPRRGDPAVPDRASAPDLRRCAAAGGQPTPIRPRGPATAASAGKIVTCRPPCHCRAAAAPACSGRARRSARPSRSASCPPPRRVASIAARMRSRSAPPARCSASRNSRAPTKPASAMARSRLGAVAAQIGLGEGARARGVALVHREWRAGPRSSRPRRRRRGCARSPSGE